MGPYADDTHLSPTTHFQSPSALKPTVERRYTSVRGEAGGIVCRQDPAIALSPRDSGAIKRSIGHFSRKTRRPSGLVFLKAERTCSRRQHLRIGTGIVLLSRTRPPRGGAHRPAVGRDWLPCPCLGRYAPHTILIPPAHRGWNGNGLATHYYRHEGTQSSRACARVSTAPTPRGGQAQQHSIHVHERISLWHIKQEKQSTQGLSTAGMPTGDPSETRSWKATHSEDIRESASCEMRSSDQNSQKLTNFVPPCGRVLVAGSIASIPRS
jgi:hypothetical protein